MTAATLTAGQQPFNDLAAAQPPEFTLDSAGLLPVSNIYQPQQLRDPRNVQVQFNGLTGLYYPTVGQLADTSRSSILSQQQQRHLIQQQILLQQQQQQQQQQLLLSATLARPAFGVGANFAAPTAPPPLQPAAAAVSFEGMPIFIVPQSGTLSLNALQRANEFKLAQLASSLASTPKIDTSKHFHVFVGDLSSEIDNKMLKKAFDCCGTISEAKVIRDPQSLKSRGYGFVSFPEKKDAQRAIDEMNGATVGRRAVRTNWASRRAVASNVVGCASDEEKGMAGASAEVEAAALDRLMAAADADNTTVYVGNLANSVEGDGDREEELREAFKQFGDIKEIRLFLVQNYGFVVFERKRSAAHAILALNGTELRAYPGRRLRCSWGRAGLGANTSNTVSQHDTTSLNALATAHLIVAQYAASQSNQSIKTSAQNANALLAAQMSAISHQQQQQQQMAAVAAAAAAASNIQPPAFDALTGQLPQSAWPN